MKLNCSRWGGPVDFGRVHMAPGACNFTDGGYPFHPLWKHFGMDWNGYTFWGKTLVIDSRAGKMPLREDGCTPKELIPKCIFVWPFSGGGWMVNAVGLAAREAEFYFELGVLQARTEPFGLSYMPVANGEGAKEERLDQTHRFTDLLQKYLPAFQAPVALQFNGGCPNVEVGRNYALWQHIYEETAEHLQILAALEIPLIANFSPVAPPELLIEVVKLPECAGLCIGNSIPVGYPCGINWRRAIWPFTKSPLLFWGLSAGGYSGPAAISVVCDRLRAVAPETDKPLIGGNGIRKRQHIFELHAAGATDFHAGSVGVVRPWRMGEIREAIVSL